MIYRYRFLDDYMYFIGKQELFLQLTTSFSYKMYLAKLYYWFISDMLYVFSDCSVTGLPMLPNAFLISHRSPISFCIGPGVIAWSVHWSSGVPESLNCNCIHQSRHFLSHWSTRCYYIDVIDIIYNNLKFSIININKIQVGICMFNVPLVGWIFKSTDHIKNVLIKITIIHVTTCQQLV